MSLQISLFQRSKANHNLQATLQMFAPVVTNIIISKIESKSQLMGFCNVNLLSCYKYHYFKDRKQITTQVLQVLHVCALLQISLFQRSKANHNWLNQRYKKECVVTNIIISKIESKSQQNDEWVEQTFSCYKYHYFKDRKQITTTLASLPTSLLLLQISLFQRSKANHNKMMNGLSKHSVVTNIIISKIESKSQPISWTSFDNASCYKYHYFKDRKQITTDLLKHPQ